MPIIFIASKDENYEKTLNNIEEVRARGGRIIAIANEKDERLEKIAEKVFWPLRSPAFAGSPIASRSYEKRPRRTARGRGGSD